MQPGKIYPHYEFQKNNSNLKYAPAYFLFGSEVYLKDKVMEQILNKFKVDNSEDFDIVKFYGEDTSAADIIEHLEMNPFLAEYKIVILKNFQNLKKTCKDTIGEYLTNPVQTSILILESDRNDKRTTAYKLINKFAICVECRPPYGARDILLWLRGETSRRNIYMNSETANLFASYIQPDYLIASNELEKLITAAKNKKEITIDDVAMCVGRSKTNTIFELQNCLGKKDLKKALLVLENLIENNESSIFIVTMLTSFFTNIWKILILRKNKINESEIKSRYLKDIFPKFRNDYLGFARNHDSNDVRMIFSLLLQTDIDLKSLDVKEALLLETLIYKICKNQEL